MIPLTAKQQELLAYLRSCDSCPSYTEMQDALGLASKSVIHRLITGLEERGYVRRIPDRVRAIEVVKSPRLPRSLSGFRTKELAREARRRGLYLGHIHRAENGRRVFAEVDA